MVENDPLEYDFPLPLRALYHPMGVAVEVVTNSSAILAESDRMWARYPDVFGASPVVFRVIVLDCDAPVAVRPVMPAGQGHLLSIVHGPDNFAVCDLARSFGFARLTKDVASDAAYLRYHFLEPAIYLMIEARYFTPVHGSCISLNGCAILLCGDSGAGKTSLAYECARTGWRYISDDATYILRNRSDHVVAGRPFSIRFREAAKHLFPELERFEAVLRPNGKLDLEVDTAELNLAIAVEGRVSHVVFLERGSAACESRLDVFPRAEAMRLLSAAVCYGDERIRAEQTAALQVFLELPIVKLTYADVTKACAALRELLK